MKKTPHEIVVITGGAGGIGSATVQKYAGPGRHIIIGDLNSEEGKKISKGSDGKVSYIHLDILDYESILNFARTIQQSHGSVSHLISMAGGALPDETVGKGIESTSAECISRSIDLNLKSHLYLIKELLPLIRIDVSSNRTVTLISSINALFSFGQPAYSAAKAGMIGLVHALANELGGYNIRINAVLPGTTPTKTCHTFLESSFDELKNASALKRLSTPGEIANAIFAVTHLMTSVTGQYIVVDSGQTITYNYTHDPQR